MTRAALAVLLLAVSACSATAAERKEAVIQGALEAAFVACAAALSDPEMTWDKDAREYCERVVNAPIPCEAP